MSECVQEREREGEGESLWGEGGGHFEPTKSPCRASLKRDIKDARRRRQRRRRRRAFSHSLTRSTQTHFNWVNSPPYFVPHSILKESSHTHTISLPRSPIISHTHSLSITETHWDVLSLSSHQSLVFSFYLFELMWDFASQMRPEISLSLSSFPYIYISLLNIYF